MVIPPPAQTLSLPPPLVSPQRIACSAWSLGRWRNVSETQKISYKEDPQALIGICVCETRLACVAQTISVAVIR